MSGIKENLIDLFLHKYPEESAIIFNDSSTGEILEHLKNLPPQVAGSILVRMNSDRNSEILSEMDDRMFSGVAETLNVYSAAILLSRLDEDLVREKLAVLPEKLAGEIREVMTYPYDSAGYIMDTRIISFNPESRISMVTERLRLHRDRRFQNIYVVDTNGLLLGRVPIQMIAIADPDEILGDLLERSPSVHVMAPQEEVVEILRNGNIISLPVVDLNNTLLGIIRYDALVKAAQSDATEDVQAIFGAGREERALSKVTFAIRKRLPWLEINLATAFLAASVVGIFEETIARITVLAVFLPVVAGQSGNTGSQALAVTIRGLALREFRIAEWRKVAKKEVAVGFINGVAVALTTSVIVYFWASSFGLSLVILISMILSMVVAGFSGAVIPILLKSAGQDPAQSSSIVLTTVTDIVGFFSFLGLATLFGGMIGIS